MRNNRIRKVGTCSKGKWLATFDGRATKEYQMWNDMLQRCYSERKQLKNQSYVGCTVDNSFLEFQDFMLWAEKQAGFGLSGWELDKDILDRDNKIYGPETCVFIPQHLNTFYTEGSRRKNKEDPIGVYWHKADEKYMARIWIDGNQRYLGHFEDPYDGFLVYKKVKESEAKRLAEKYKEHLDSRVYNVLTHWEVKPTD